MGKDLFTLSPSGINMGSVSRIPIEGGMLFQVRWAKVLMFVKRKGFLVPECHHLKYSRKCIY